MNAFAAMEAQTWIGSIAATAGARSAIIATTTTWSDVGFEYKVSFTGWKDRMPNECNGKLRHYKHGEWTFGPCKLDVAESSSERVV